MIVTSRPTSHADERGWITDIVQDVEVQHATLIISAKGSERGHHYHKETTQYLFLVTGQLQVLAQRPDEPTVCVIVNPGDLVIHEPLEAHAVLALEDSAFLVLTRGPRGGTGYESDTFRLAQKLVA